MQHIGRALKKLIKKRGLEKGLNQQKALEIWPDIVGQQVAKNTDPVSIEFGVLTVKSTSPVWRQELQLQKENIIQSINNKLNKNIIKDIRFI